MKLYFKPVMLMSEGGDENLYPPGYEGSAGGGDGGEWGGGIGGDGGQKKSMLNVSPSEGPSVLEQTTTDLTPTEDNQ